MPNNGNADSGGLNTNKNGLLFETQILDLIKEQAVEDGFIIEELQNPYAGTYFSIAKNDKSYTIGTQNTIHHYLVNKFSTTKEVLLSIWEKELRPDIYIIDNNDFKVHLIECKFQVSSGSVDEKLQTSEFKIKMWNKLLRNVMPNSESVSYTYVLSSWFNQPGRKDSTNKMYFDTLEFLRSKNVGYYIDVNNNDHTIEDKVKKDGTIDTKADGTPKKVKIYRIHELQLNEPTPFNLSDILNN